jgi:hypothetical protein
MLISDAQFSMMGESWELSVGAPCSKIKARAARHLESYSALQLGCRHRYHRCRRLVLHRRLSCALRATAARCHGRGNRRVARVCKCTRGSHLAGTRSRCGSSPTALTAASV